MNMEFSYKSFCWCLGTTSFRTKNFNKTIETQLGLLDSFWKLPENVNAIWDQIVQKKYYDYMKKNNFLVGEAKIKDKDARQKTSGMVALGLLKQNRKLSDVGVSLLNMSRENNFETDNFLKIPKDSFLFAKQLLKMHCKVETDIVRPFIILIYALSKADFLSFEEFKYLLPLCTNEENTDDIIHKILLHRQNKLDIDQIIFDRIISIDNYSKALEYFLEQPVSESVISTIALNRKSSEKYTKAYFPLYNALKSVYLNKQSDKIKDLFNAIMGLSGGTKDLWKKYIFGKVSKKLMEIDPAALLNVTEFDRVINEKELKLTFFKVLHINKAKTLLDDYFDLNRRYFNISDLILFQEDKVELDIIPKHFFVSVADCLYQEAFRINDKLFNNIELEEISPCLILNKEDILARINTNFGTQAKNLEEVNQIVEDERYKRLQQLIDDKFTDKKILALLDMFQSRADTEIQARVTDNADVPTIFEYVLGILWYKISERQGKVLDYMKLSLGADLLPKTHAAGGEADIVYEYSGNDDYPEHSLLLEATLADSTNQRRMEMEPVSRHLGQHLLRSKNMDSYCIFATNYLHPNVVSDFRSRKNVPYYDQQDDTECVESMKIIPLSTDDLKAIIRTGRKYRDLYRIFDNAYKDETQVRPLEWRKQMIENILSE